MKQLKLDIENCYGIRRLKADLDFSNGRANAIYAPNGAMKSSLAKVFQDIADGAVSKDRIFTSRVSKRSVTDESGSDLPMESVLVVRPYDEVFGHTAKTSTLLVNSVLRVEYEQLHVEVDKAKTLFLKALKEQSGSKKDLEKEISRTFTTSDDQFFRALSRVREELLAQKDAPFAEVRYDIIFDEKVLALLATKDFKTAIESYIKKYNELLSASTYFKKGLFTYYHGATIAKSLADNGFFKAKHSIRLNADTTLDITNETQLAQLIDQEKAGISNDKSLKKTFADIEKLITKNVTVREFETYLTENEEILAQLANVDQFREDIWKSYFHKHMPLFSDLIEKFRAAEDRRREIEEQAAQESTQWENVIDIFNERFFVPFTLQAKNRTSVILGQEPMLSLGFTFDDGEETAPVERSALIDVLSQGEKKALYILNIIFEIEARRHADQNTILIVDDVADSFDYRNKYAIIQYLKEISEDVKFTQIILTHNFDFFRTINLRFVDHQHCYMVSKSISGVTLSKASGIRNVFVKDWKPNFFKNPKKMIASVPFIRNLIEFTSGDTDPQYAKLTSLLHWKADTAAIRHGEIDVIYNALFGATGASPSPNDLVLDTLFKHADECLSATDGVNFEHKIVLSIAIRLRAEKFMTTKIADPTFSLSITSNQTPKLLTRYKALFPAEPSAVKVLEKVTLMTPENIHLNSFMYEPILDMSDEHLRRLYEAVKSLS